MQNTIRIGIDGMHCGSCETKIRNALLMNDEVQEATVSAKSGTAELVVANGASNAAISDAIEHAGSYRVRSIESVETPANKATHAHTHVDQHTEDETAKESLYPLFLIVGFIAGVTLLIAASSGNWSIEPMMRNFMAGFFLVFSFFKLLDLAGFVSAYRGYDLIARKLGAWGWAYPFVELTLGVSYLMGWAPIATNAITLVLMLIGAAGVLKALLDKRAIRCACLGTALNLPMTKVTLVEDLTMAVMAGVMLLLIM